MKTLIRNLSIFSVLILAACTRPISTSTEPVPTESANPTSTATPTATPLPEVEYETPLEVISAENIGRLEMITTFGEGYIFDAALSPDEETIAVYTTTGINLYDSKTLEYKEGIEVEIYQYPRYSFPLTFSPDGNILAYADTKKIHFYDLSLKHGVHSIYLDIPDSQISNLEFSPDGNRILVTSFVQSILADGQNTNFSLYDLDGNLLFSDDYFPGYIDIYYKFTSDNRLHFFYSSAFDKIFLFPIWIVDASTGNILAADDEIFYDTTTSPYAPPDYAYYDISFDGKIIAILEYEGETPYTRILNANTGATLEIVEGLIEFYETDEGITQWRSTIFKYSWESTYVTYETCGFNDYPLDKYIELYTFDDMAVLQYYRYYNIIASYNLELWNLSTCEVEEKISFSAARDGKVQFTDNYLITSNGYDIYGWDLQTNEIHFVIEGRPFEAPWDAFIVNSDGTKLIASTLDHHYETNTTYTLYIWDIKSGDLLKTIPSNGKILQTIYSTPNANVIITKDKNGLNFWDIEKGEHLSILPVDFFESFVFGSEDGQIWLKVKLDTNKDQIKLFDYRTGIELKTIDEVFYSVYSLWQITDDMNIAVYGNINAKNSVYIFDGKTGENLDIIESTREKHFSEFINSTQFIASKSLESYYLSNYEIWDYNSDTPLFTLPAIGPISPDGKIMVTNHEENKLYFWSMENGQYLGQIYIGTRISNITFSPDGRLIAITFDNGIIHLYGVPEE